LGRLLRIRLWEPTQQQEKNQMKFEIKKFSSEERGDDVELDEYGHAYSIFDIEVRVKTDAGIFHLTCEY
jgi:hypothetical protein